MWNLCKRSCVDSHTTDRFEADMAICHLIAVILQPFTKRPLSGEVSLAMLR